MTQILHKKCSPFFKLIFCKFLGVALISDFVTNEKSDIFIPVTNAILEYDWLRTFTSNVQFPEIVQFIGKLPGRNFFLNKS